MAHLPRLTTVLLAFGVVSTSAPTLAEVVRSGRVKLVTYRQIIANSGGVSAMRRPQP